MCLCVVLFAAMAVPKSVDPHLRRLEEIENNVRSFMSLQFEHNNFFRNKLKEQKSFMGYMNKELDDMSKDFYGLRSQFAHLENLVGQISDKQATLVNKMATKPEAENNDEDLKVIDMTHIKSLFTIGGKRHLWGHWDPFYGWRARGCAKSGSGGQHKDRLPRFGPRRCVIP